MSVDPQKAVESVVGDLTYEDRDIHLKGVIIFVLITFAVILVAFVSMLFTLNSLRDREVASGVPESVLAENNRGINENVPMLQVWPVRELQAYHDREATRLETSAAYTTPAGEEKFHIPVNHAMELVLDDLNAAPAAAEETP